MSFSDVVRREFKASDDERDRGLTTPSEVIRFDNICYADEGINAGGKRIDLHERQEEQWISRWQFLDVYRPADAGNMKLPVIVSVHGGGWVYGDKEVYQYYCMELCRRGYAVVNFSYRLAPVFKFPTQLEDTNKVFHWVLSNADEYGFDTDRIYAVGDSAGANILGLFCLMCTNEEYAAKYEFNVPDIKVINERNNSGDAGNNAKCNSDIAVKKFVPRAVGLNCGAYDIKENIREMRGFMKELMPNKGTPEELDMLNVTRYINKDFPPTFLMTCYGDFLMNQAPLLEMKFKELGVPYVSRLYGSKEEPLKHVFHCDIRMKEAKICNDETCRFFESIK